MIAHSLYKPQPIYYLWRSGTPYSDIENAQSYPAKQYWKNQKVTVDLVERVFPLVLKLEELLYGDVFISLFTGKYASISFTATIPHVKRVVLPIFSAACSREKIYLRVDQEEPSEPTQVVGYTFVLKYR